MSYTALQDTYRRHLAMLWGNLSRLNNLMVVMNISMFFLSGLVAKGYFFTFFSLGCLGVVGVATLLPLPLIDRLWYYLGLVVLEMVGLYFLVSSVVYWLRHSDLPAMS